MRLEFRCGVYHIDNSNLVCFLFDFFFNDTATTEIYTLSLHDALPIWLGRPLAMAVEEDREPARLLRSHDVRRERIAHVHPAPRLAARGLPGGVEDRPRRLHGPDVLRQDHVPCPAVETEACDLRPLCLAE